MAQNLSGGLIWPTLQSEKKIFEGQKKSEIPFTGPLKIKKLTLIHCQYEFLDFWLDKLSFQQNICPSSEPLKTYCPQGEKVPLITKFSVFEKPLNREMSEFEPSEYIRMRESAEDIKTRSSKQSMPKISSIKRPIRKVTPKGPI